MAVSEEETKSLQDAKAGKIWCALRVASKSNLARVDKADDGRNLQALLSTEAGVNGVSEDSRAETTNGKVEMSAADHADEDGHEQPRPASQPQTNGALDDAADGK